MIQTLCDVGESYKVTNKMDGAVYSLIPDCIISGVGNQFAETHSSLTMTIQSGEAVMCGNFFKLTDTESITLSEGTGYVCLSIDSTKTNGSRGYLSFKSSSDIKSENLNGSGTLRDLPIYKVVCSSSAITSVSDTRTIKSADATAIGGKAIVTCTQSEYDAMSSHASNTLYFILES